MINRYQSKLNIFVIHKLATIYKQKFPSLSSALRSNLSLRLTETLLLQCTNNWIIDDILSMIWVSISLMYSKNFVKGKKKLSGNCAPSNHKWEKIIKLFSKVKLLTYKQHLIRNFYLIMYEVKIFINIEHRSERETKYCTDILLKLQRKQYDDRYSMLPGLQLNFNLNHTSGVVDKHFAGNNYFKFMTKFCVVTIPILKSKHVLLLSVKHF
ncbi:hypothetical protein AGLY_008098 [Aphis glycines]|uniref:Uncharacterized protein n=1 Tax=Aphis glycines TaxID=307491 RepID=A0A6G0TN45_APHGL|nr:hypothetical protein AGLY_008098 [Aphis glycines]